MSNYRRTQELRNTRGSGDTPSKSRASKMAGSTLSKRKATQEREVPPEDNWNAVGNPSVYFDELPQPYRFINKCLQDLILNPVSEAITKIEERKKTTEYEGFVKEAQATGSLDLEGTTVMENVSCLVGPGGSVSKEEQHNVNHKILTGDNFGEVQLVDTSRKLTLDKFKVPGFESRRIISITTSSIEWVGTQLSYVAVVARGSPIINILAFKHNENKLRRLYSVNLLPDLANPEQPELNERQSYLEFPYEVKLSIDGVFLAVTQLTGAVKLIKMPPVLNPLEVDKTLTSGEQPVGSRDGKPPTGNRVEPVRSSADNGSVGSIAGGLPMSDTENTVMIKNDIDKFAYEQLDLAKVLIETIPAKKKNEFVDPFAFDEESKDTSMEEPVQEQPSKPQTQKGKAPAQAEVVETEEDDGSFKYRLGSKQQKDAEQGDAGCLYKRPEVMPSLFFIRASFVSKLNAQMPHSELQHIGKSLKQFYITTGLGIAYLNDFDVQIYNIQKPCRENVVPDYTQDYFAKVITARRINAKKAEKAAAKPEKTLASLIKSAREKAAEKAASTKPQTQDSMIEKMRKSVSAPMRNFTMPYQITAVAYQGGEEERQNLAIGLIDGAIIVIDLQLGIEKFFVEKHPSAITAIQFYEDRVLVSGSVDGRVNLCDLDSDNQARIYKCQNCQDRKIPIAKIVTSEYGIATVLDIEGNCRLYDMIRLRKLCKISCKSLVQGSKQPTSWRMLPYATLISVHDSFLGAIQTPDVNPLLVDEEGEGSVQQTDGEAEPPQTHSEQDLVVNGLYSDAPEKLKSIQQIEREAPEHLFQVQKSQVYIYRFEDVIFSLFPHLAAYRKRGTSSKEVFHQHDPFGKSTMFGRSDFGAPTSIKPAATADVGFNQTALRSAGLHSKKSYENQSIGSGGGAGKSQVGFQLGGPKTPIGGDQQQSKSYGAPTLKMLNPELFKEIEKQEKQMKDPIFVSVRNLKERYGYHEMRVQRIQRRTEELTKELEARNEEMLRRKKAQQLKQEVAL